MALQLQDNHATNDSSKGIIIKDTAVSSISESFVVKCKIQTYCDSVAFLLDSGAAFSCVPVSLARRLGVPLEDSNVQLLSCDGSSVSVFGMVRLHIVIVPLRREFFWNFVVAELSQPILGLDFLSHFSLILDCGRKVLRDSRTGLICSISSHTAQQSTTHSPEVSLDHIPTSVRSILQKFPELTQPKSVHRFINTGVKHHIALKESSSPPWSKPRRLAGHKLQCAREEINKLLALGIIRPSSSMFASPIHMAKKGDNFRLTGDYRLLNHLTTPDRYPLPHIHDFSDRLAGATVFSKIDLVRAFNQLPVADEDIPKTAITTPFGSFEYVSMPFGLRNSPASFQRFMDTAFRQQSDYSFAYVDDILVFSKSHEEHLRHLEAIFRTLKAHNLMLALHKCLFQVSELDFLGYHVSAAGLRPMPSRVASFSEQPRPVDHASLRSYTAALGFYRRMIPNFADRISLLQTMVHQQEGSKQLYWTDEADQQFRESRTLLTNAVMLHHLTPSSLFHLVTDASSYAVGAALHQIVDGQPKPIGFFSKKLSASQQKYSTFDRELLAAYLASLHFKKFIEGREVLLFTDHKPLVAALQRPRDAKLDRQQRHMAVITELVSEFHYIRGKENVVADFLSRYPSEDIATVATVEDHAAHQPCDLPAIADAQQNDEELKAFQPRLETFPLPCGKQLFCDVSSRMPRPFVPEALRSVLFKELHGLYHPGVRSSIRLLTERYYWPDMRREIKELARLCLQCQQNKIQTHTKSPIAEFQLPTTARFQFVHCDLVGPLPPATENGIIYRYLLTAIDRTTRWPEVCPLVTIDAVSVANALINMWISRWGAPLYLCTDQGRQFESALFTELSKAMGFHRIRSTAYHPQTNGMIERFHRTLKAALRSSGQQWLDALPAVLLGLRSHPHADNKVSPFEMVTGATLCVPPVSVVSPSTVNSEDLVKKLAKHFQKDFAPFARGSNHNTNFSPQVPDELQTTSHVWLRVDRVLRSLESPYEGPYRVIRRNSKTFTIAVPTGKHVVVSIDRVKPAKIQNTPSSVDSDRSDTSNSPSHSVNIPPSQTNFSPSTSSDAATPDSSDVPSTSYTSSSSEPSPDPPVVGRSGRRVRFNRNPDFHYF